MLAYAFWSTDGIREQGLYLDVALWGRLGMEFMEGLSIDTPFHIRLFGKAFPLMVNAYNGASEVYLAVLPALAFSGDPVLSLNLSSVFWGALLVGSSAWLAWGVYGTPWAAVAVVWLLGTAPSLVAGARVGIFAGVVHSALFAAGLASLFMYRDRGSSPFWLLAGGTLLGLAWGGRSLIVWYLVPLGLCLFLFNGPRRLWTRLPLRWKALPSAALFLGITPVILANWRGDFFTLKFITRYLAVSRTGVSNLDYVPNFLERLREAFSLLDATALSTVNEKNIAGTALLGAAIFFFLRRIRAGFREGLPWSGQAWIWPLLVLMLVLLQSPVSPTLYHVHHLFPLYPVLGVLVCGPLFLSTLKGRGRWWRGAFALLLVCYSAGNTYLFAKHRVHEKMHGGNEVRWNVMGDVYEWLQANGIHEIAMGDTGLLDPLLVVSGRKIRVTEVFYANYLDRTEAEVLEDLRRRIRRQEEGYYLFRAAGSEMVRFADAFHRVANEEGKEAEPVREFSTPTGIPVFTVYRVS